MQAKPDTIQLVNGDLISTTFLINMADTINEMLQTGSPALGLTELAQQFALPVDQVQKCLDSHTGARINGVISSATFLHAPNVSTSRSVVHIICMFTKILVSH